jgi:hypothetical protein
MFFPEKIKNIKTAYLVLEVGPGGTPHPRSDVLLEKHFTSEREALGQRGYEPELRTEKMRILYGGGRLPFKDKAFDYVICSHVLEHVRDIEYCVSEIQRIAPRGYFEFPTIYYDFVYNFPEHTTLLLYQNEKIYYMLKEESPLNQFLSVHRFFYETLQAGYDSLIRELLSHFFQGFEWFERIETQKAASLDEITFDVTQMRILPRTPPKEEKQPFRRLRGLIRKVLC